VLHQLNRTLISWTAHIGSSSVRSLPLRRLGVDGRDLLSYVGDSRTSLHSWRSTLKSGGPAHQQSETGCRVQHRPRPCGFVDGSGWEGVYQIPRKSGHAVTVVQNATTSLADDVAVTKRALDQQPDQAELVGAVVRRRRHRGRQPCEVAAPGLHRSIRPRPRESVNTLIADPPSGAPVPPILPPQDGFLFLDKDKFAASFTADVNPELAAFMADSEVPWGVDALAGAITEPAWRTKPSWYLVATEDRMIPPDAQRQMSQ
jgi:hypothetical protein